jgi:hypothetical protein
MHIQVWIYLEKIGIAKEKILEFLQRDEDVTIEPDWKQICNNIIEDQILDLDFPKF